jgi:hypothetical protein
MDLGNKKEKKKRDPSIHINSNGGGSFIGEMRSTSAIIYFYVS